MSEDELAGTRFPQGGWFVPLIGFIAVVAAFYSVSLLVGGSELPPRLLLVGTNVWPGYEPLYLARDLGSYDEHEVRLVEYSSATQVLRAFRNGSIEVAGLTLDEALTLKEHHIPLRVVAVADISDGADVLLAHTEIADLEGLRGKRIGVEGTAVGAYILTRALEAAGLARDEVEFVSLEIQEQEVAFLEGRVDAVVTFEPVRSRLLEAGARELFDSSLIPGEIVDVLAVHESVLRETPDALLELLVGWFDALEYLRDHPLEASARMGPRLGLEAEAVLASYDGLQLPDLAGSLELIGGDAPKLEATAAHLVQTMLADQLLDGEVSVIELFDASILERIKRERSMRPSHDS